MRNQGDKIWFDLTDGTVGWGTVNGIAITELPGLGVGWIIEPTEPIIVAGVVYPFTHIMVFDSMIKEVPKEDV
jgi:hypothetical protein